MKKPSVEKEYKDHNLVAININWTRNLSHAWQTVVYRTPTSFEVFYGQTPADCFERAMNFIDRLTPPTTPS